MKKKNPVARILFSVALLAVVIYMYQQRKSSSAASKIPFLTESPSAAGTDRFAWIPSYPGANISGIHSRMTHGELNYGYEFQSADDLRPVISFYESRLRATGFTVQTKPKGDIEIDLHAESPDRKRMLDVVAEKVQATVAEKATGKAADTTTGKTPEKVALAGSVVTVAAVQK